MFDFAITDDKIVETELVMDPARIAELDVCCSTIRRPADEPRPGFFAPRAS